MSYNLFLDFKNALVTVKYESKEHFAGVYDQLKERLDLFREMKLALVDKDYIVFQCKDDKKCMGKFSRSICKLNNLSCSDCVWYEETTCTKTLNLPNAIDIKIVRKN